MSSFGPSSSSCLRRTHTDYALTTTTRSHTTRAHDCACAQARCKPGVGRTMPAPPGSGRKHQGKTPLLTDSAIRRYARRPNHAMAPSCVLQPQVAQTPSTHAGPPPHPEGGIAPRHSRSKHTPSRETDSTRASCKRPKCPPPDAVSCQIDGCCRKCANRSKLC